MNGEPIPSDCQSTRHGSSAIAHPRAQTVLSASEPDRGVRKVTVERDHKGDQQDYKAEGDKVIHGSLVFPGNGVASGAT